MRLGTLEILANFASQIKITTQGWANTARIETGTRMGKKECRTITIRSRTCKYWQCLY